MDRPSCSKDPDPTEWSSPIPERPEHNDKEEEDEILKLFDEISKPVDGTTSEKINVLNKQLDKADKLFDKISGSSSSVLFADAKVMLEASNKLAELTENIDTGEGNFDYLEWSNAFMAKGTAEDEEESTHEMLMSATEGFIQETMPSGWCPVYGGLDLTREEPLPATEKKKKQQSQRDKEAEKKEPENLQQVAQDASVSQQVNHIYRNLRRLYKQNKYQPLNYFKFFIDPTSFAKSASNFFHISFLTNDNLVKLEPDEEDGLLISPITAKQREETLNSDGMTGRRIKTSIMSLDMDRWQKLIEKHNIQSAMF